MVQFYIIGALQINYAIWSAAGWLAGWLLSSWLWRLVATDGDCRFWFIAFIFGLHGHQFFAGDNSRRHVACTQLCSLLLLWQLGVAVPQWMHCHCVAGFGWDAQCPRAVLQDRGWLISGPQSSVQLNVAVYNSLQY
jgi:hypothetical protein